MEEIVLSLIMHSGEAKSYAMEAIGLAKSGNIEEARGLMQKANEEIGFAHYSQTTLIQGEAAGSKSEISLLLIHGQDHLMNTMMLIDLASELIDLYEKIK